jgi:hypothetical protein
MTQLHGTTKKLVCSLFEVHIVLRNRKIRWRKGKLEAAPQRIGAGRYTIAYGKHRSHPIFVFLHGGFPRNA